MRRLSPRPWATPQMALEAAAQVARDAGLSRESLYKALSGERSPDFSTILRVMAALGLSLHSKAVN